jgi:5-methylthioadenosine/S-adenosylhomocysteine deaminase
MAEKNRMLIKGGFVVTMEQALGVIKDASIFIEDGIIKSIGPNLAIENADVIDAQNMIVMPGFVDCHRHM